MWENFNEHMEALAYLTPLVSSYSLFTSFKVYDGAEASARRLDLISQPETLVVVRWPHTCCQQRWDWLPGAHGDKIVGLWLGPWESIKG